MTEVFYVNPEQRTALLETLSDNQTVSNLELVFKKADGSHTTVLTSAARYYDDNGKPEGVEGMFSDTSELKQAEEELRSYLANIIDSMPSILVGVDREGRVTQWNRTAEENTGTRANEAQGKLLTDILPAMASEMDKVARSIQSRQVIKAPQRSKAIGGKAVHEDLTIYPLIANGVTGAVIRVDDVTENVRLEEMMIQSEKMLSVGGLAAGMAHEINNPLAGILQTANVLANRLGDNPDIAANHRAAEAAGTTMEVIKIFMHARGVPGMLDTIKTSGQRVAETVANMLSFARKSEAIISIQRLDEVIEKSLALAATDYDLKKQFDFKRIEIVKAYDEKLPGVPCEEAKIQQVLLNILRNGAQAMQLAGTPSPHFEIRTHLHTASKMACIEIEDNGPGMDETTRKRVFEPFFTTKPEGVGTGLGLSVSYFIVTDNHSGEMAVESWPGKGTRFIIRLPLQRATSDSNDTDSP